jgi:hypothetical protein
MIIFDIRCTVYTIGIPICPRLVISPSSSAVYAKQKFDSGAQDSPELFKDTQHMTPSSSVGFFSIERKCILIWRDQCHFFRVPSSGIKGRKSNQNGKVLNLADGNIYRFLHATLYIHKLVKSIKLKLKFFSL